VALAPASMERTGMWLCCQRDGGVAPLRIGWADLKIGHYVCFNAGLKPGAYIFLG
jgi:hypothetical protein